MIPNGPEEREAPERRESVARESVEGPGGEGLFGLETPAAEAGVVIVPVPFEATVSYGRGAARGPAAVLQASAQIDLFDIETGRPYEAGIALLPEDERVHAWNREATALAARVIAAGGAGADPALVEATARVDAIMDELNGWLAREVALHLERGALVGVLGGDHSVPFASIRAHARRWPGLGILHLDAHADLRRAYEGFRWSHASILHNVREEVPEVAAVVGVGYRDLAESEHEVLASDPRFHAVYEAELRRRLQDGTPFTRIVAEAIERLPEQVYLTFDIDGLDPSLCPSTGTPVPGGLSFAEATALLRGVVESGRRIVGFDLCEVAPDPAGAHEWDANVGARLLYKMIGFALRSQRGS